MNFSGSFSKVFTSLTLLSAIFLSNISFAKTPLVVAAEVVSITEPISVDEHPPVAVDENKVTLAGHDAVAYFTENAAVKGKAEITTIYNNAIYRFSSVKNRELFTANPTKYAPQYGGFCAFGISKEKKFAVDGKAFEVVDGKLYVLKNAGVHKKWAPGKESRISTADTLTDSKVGRMTTIDTLSAKKAMTKPTVK